MKRKRIFPYVLVWLAVLGVCLPPSALAADPPKPQPQPPAVLGDVTLGFGGVLVGKVTNAEGAPVAKAPVTLQHDTHVVATGFTDEQGVFTFKQVRGGVHQVASAQQVGTYRLWAPGTAPPSAEPFVRLASTRSSAPRPWQRAPKFLSNPWILAAIIATAIAVPVALAASDKSPGS